MVVNSKGEAVSEARIMIYGIKGSYSVSDFPVRVVQLTETKTDAEGRFEIEVDLQTVEDTDSQFVVVEADGFALGWSSCDYFDASAEKAIVLEKPSVVAGKVIDADGSPINGVMVSAIIISSRAKETYYVWTDDLASAVASTGVLTDTTDGAGQFRIEKIPFDATIEFVVRDKLGRYLKTSTWNASEYRDKGKFEAGAKDIVITMPKASIVTGVVVDKETGEFVKGVRVSLVGQRSDGTGRYYITRVSGDNGTFNMQCAPGRYLLIFGPWVLGSINCTAEPVEVIAKENASVMATLYIVREPPPEPVTEVRSPAGSIIGTITDASGQALSGVEVYGVPGGSEVWVSDANGRIEIAAEEPVDFALENTAINGEPKRVTHLVGRDVERNLGGIRRIPKGAATFDFELSDGFVISGRVVDEDGAPIADADVFLETIPDHGLQKITIQSCVTDEQGSYSLTAIPHGYDYTVAATAQNYGENLLKVSSEKPGMGVFPPGLGYGQRVENMPIMVEPNKRSVEVRDIVLRKSGLVVSGVVFDTLGNRVANAVVEVGGKGQPTLLPIRTDSNGCFIINDLCAGEVELTIDESPDVYYNRFSMTRVTVQAGTEQIIVLVRSAQKVASEPSEPKEGGLIEVLVRDADSKEPLDGAQVYFRGDRMVDDVYQFANEDGLMHVVLPSGRGVVSGANRWGYERKKLNEQVDVVDGQTYRIVVELDSMAICSGIVQDQQGEPIGGAQMYVPGMCVDDSVFVTKADGRFHFRWDVEDAFKEAREPGESVGMVVWHVRRNLAVMFEAAESSMEDLTIVLEPMLTITGRVMDRSGKPVPRALVELKMNCWNTLSECIGSTRFWKSDSNGEYRIEGLPRLVGKLKYKLSVLGWRTEIELGPEDIIPGKVTVVDIILGKGNSESK